MINKYKHQQDDSSSPPLALSCPPRSLAPAAGHYSRNVSLGQMPGVWWHINDRGTMSPGHLRVISMAHLNPCHAPRLSFPAPPTLTAAAGLWASQSQEAGCGCVSQGGDFMGSRCPINLLDMHAYGSCLVCYGLARVIKTLDTAGTPVQQIPRTASNKQKHTRKSVLM